jgi:hypothetical protein
MIAAAFSPDAFSSIFEVFIRFLSEFKSVISRDLFIDSDCPSDDRFAALEKFELNGSYVFELALVPYKKNISAVFTYSPKIYVIDTLGLDR